MKNKKTCHHIIPTSRWWLEDRWSNNTIYLTQKVHSALHLAFGNAFPTEQILEILKNPKNKKLKNSKKEDLFWLLTLDLNRNIYIPELIVNIDDFLDLDLRTGHVQNVNKITNFQKAFFRREKTPEEKIHKILSISSKVLVDSYKNELYNILN